MSALVPSEPLMPFHQWKEQKRREMSPTVMPRDWYHTVYGQWCNSQRARALKQKASKK